MKRFMKVMLICQIFPWAISSPLANADQTCKTSIIVTTPNSNFVTSQDGTTIDNTTGLMWMRCSLGQTLGENTCSNTATTFSWSEGLIAAANHEFAGYTDWRLPNKNELESIVEASCSSPAININVFPATPETYFWSSSPYAPVGQAAWSVDFAFGTVNATLKSASIPIRLVRDTELIKVPER